MQNNINFSSLGSDIDKNILELCRKQGKIAAVKFCKEITGWEDLKTSKDYVDRLLAENSTITKSPLIIERGGMRGCLFFPGLIFCLIWIGACAIIPIKLFNEGAMHSNESWFKPMIYIVFGIVSLPGFIFLVIFARMEYDEKIEFLSTQVNYFKKGWLRKTQQWEEPLKNYNGVTTSEDEGTDDAVIYLVVLEHTYDKRKNIIIEQNVKSKEKQLEIQTQYSSLLNLPILKESVKSEANIKKYLLISIVLISCVIVAAYFSYKESKHQKPSANHSDEPYAP